MVGTGSELCWGRCTRNWWVQKRLREFEKGLVVAEAVPTPFKSCVGQ